MSEQDQGVNFDAPNPAESQTAPIQETTTENVAPATQEPDQGQPEKTETDVFKDYFDSNPNPLAESFVSNPDAFAPQQPQQFTYNVNQQQSYQQPPQQFDRQQNQQFQQMTPQEQKMTQEAIKLGIDNETALKFVDNDDYAGLLNLFAEKIQENIQNLSTKQQDSMRRIAQEEQIKQATIKEQNEIKTAILNNISKEGLKINTLQQDMIYNFAASPAMAVDTYGRQVPIIDYRTGQPVSMIDKAYNDYAQIQTRNRNSILPIKEFAINYLSNLAVKSFGKKQSQAPNNLIRETINPIHAQGSPVTTKSVSVSDIDAMDEPTFKAYIAERKRSNQ